jgi:hypothetical protein
MLLHAHRLCLLFRGDAARFADVAKPALCSTNVCEKERKTAHLGFDNISTDDYGDLALCYLHSLSGNECTLPARCSLDPRSRARACLLDVGSDFYFIRYCCSSVHLPRA